MTNIKNFINNMDLKNLSLIQFCLKICFVISLTGLFIIYLSHENPISIPIIYVGIKLLYIGFFYSIFSIICGISMDIIKKQMN